MILIWSSRNPARRPGYRAPELGVLGLLFSLLNPAFDFADSIQILADFGPIGGAEALLESLHLVVDGIQNAVVHLLLSQALRSAPPVAKRRSKTTRGLISIGSGSVGVRQEIELK